MPAINPAILKWARETAKLSPEEAAKKVIERDAGGVTATDRLISLEAGKTTPTRSQLVKASKLYRRSLLLFYLSEIPPAVRHTKDFRSLHQEVGQPGAGLVNAAVRQIRVRQDLVRAAMEAANEINELQFIGTMAATQDAVKISASIQELLQFKRPDFRNKRSRKKSFAYLRELVENQGIFVILFDNLGSHHSSIEVEMFRGFALADHVAPFVVVNINDSPSAWSFTLLHELAHLWIGETGISGGISSNSIEVLCNDVASELLLPSSEISTLDIPTDSSIDEIRDKIFQLAEAWKASNTMVAYRLYCAGYFGSEIFERLRNEFHQAFRGRGDENSSRSKGHGGPDYYRMRQHCVGMPLIRFAERMINEGCISTIRAGKILGVSAKNVDKLIERGRNRRAAKSRR